MKLITLNLAIVEMVITRGGICYCVFFFFFFLRYENRALVEIQRERERERERAVSGLVAGGARVA